MRGVATEGQHNAAVVQKIFHNKGHVNTRRGGVVSDFIALQVVERVSAGKVIVRNHKPPQRFVLVHRANKLLRRHNAQIFLRAVTVDAKDRGADPVRRCHVVGKKIEIAAVFARVGVGDIAVPLGCAVAGILKNLLDGPPRGRVRQVELIGGILQDGTEHFGVGRERDRIVRNDAACDNATVGHAEYIVGFDGDVPCLACPCLQVKTHPSGERGWRLAVRHTVDIAVIVQFCTPCVGAKRNFPNLAAVQRNGKQLGVAVIAVHDDVQRVVC